MTQSPWFALLVSSAFTGYSYFTFEIVLPYADKVEAMKAECTSANGTLLTVDSKTLCVDNSTIIKFYDN